MNLYNYRAIPIRVIDGDTVWLKIDLGMRVFIEAPCRLWGINAPEMKGDTLEKSLAAQVALRDMLYESEDVEGNVTVVTPRNLFVESRELDKYGRPLVRIFTADPGPIPLWGESVNATMVEAGHAVEMKG